MVSNRSSRKDTIMPQLTRRTFTLGSLALSGIIQNI
jgi:hypothetical protein